MDILYEKIIKQLLNMNVYVTTKELSEIIGVSSSTVKHNLKHVKKELEKFHIDLISCQGKGVYLVATDDQRHKITKYMEKHKGQNSNSNFYRKNYMIETLLEYPAAYTIQLFAEELNVSRHTIMKDLDKVSEYFSKNNLRLVKKRNSGIYVEGNEFYFRQAIILINNTKYWNPVYLEIPQGIDCRLSNRAYTFLTNIYKDTDIGMIQEQIYHIEKKINVIFSDISFGRLMEFISVTIRRIRQGNIITEVTKNNLSYSEQTYSEVAEDILKNLLGVEEIEWPLEVQYMAVRIQISKVCNKSNICCGTVYKDEAFKFTLNISEILSENMLKFDHYFINDIGLMFERVSIRENYQMVAWDDLHLDVQECLSGLYAICMANLDEVSSDLNIRFTPDDIAYITLLVHNAIKKNKDKVQAVLVTATDYDTAKFQEHKIEKEVLGLKIIANIHYSEFVYEKYQSNLIISTIPLELKDSEYIKVTKHFWATDIGNISTKVKELNEKDTSHKSDTNPNNCIFNNFLIIDLKVADKKEVIEMGIKRLIEEGYVNNEFSKFVWEREDTSSTYIGNGIAIPHVYKKGVKKSGLILIRLKYPTQWTATEKVKMVFLIAVNYETQKEIGDYFSQLYELISSVQDLDMLYKSKDINEFIDVRDTNKKLYNRISD